MKVFLEVGSIHPETDIHSIIKQHTKISKILTSQNLFALSQVFKEICLRYRKIKPVFLNDFELTQKKSTKLDQKSKQIMKLKYSEAQLKYQAKVKQLTDLFFEPLCQIKTVISAYHESYLAISAAQAVYLASIRALDHQGCQLNLDAGLDAPISVEYLQLTPCESYEKVSMSDTLCFFKSKYPDTYRTLFAVDDAGELVEDSIVIPGKEISLKIQQLFSDHSAYVKLSFLSDHLSIYSSTTFTVYRDLKISILSFINQYQDVLDLTLSSPIFLSKQDFAA